MVVGVGPDPLDQRRRQRPLPPDPLGLVEERVGRGVEPVRVAAERPHAARAVHQEPPHADPVDRLDARPVHVPPREVVARAGGQHLDVVVGRGAPPPRGGTRTRRPRRSPGRSAGRRRRAGGGSAGSRHRTRPRAGEALEVLAEPGADGLGVERAEARPLRRRPPRRGDRGRAPPGGAARRWRGSPSPGRAARRRPWCPARRPPRRRPPARRSASPPGAARRSPRARRGRGRPTPGGSTRTARPGTRCP